MIQPNFYQLSTILSILLSIILSTFYQLKKVAKDLALNLVQPKCECFKASARHIWGPEVAPTACNPHLNLKTRETGLLSETSTLWEP